MAREKRNSGVHRRVSLSTQIQGNWQSFLRSTNNKTKLLSLLSEHVAGIGNLNKQLFTMKKQVVSNAAIRDKSQLEP